MKALTVVNERISGDKVMDTVWMRGGVVLMVLALASSAARSAAPLASDIDESLQKRALELNDVTGEDPIKGQIKVLVEDADRSKKLLSTALAMSKTKKQTFNYNAAYILARVAQELKDLDTAQAFYRMCADQAVKLHSGQKLAQSYGGLIDLLYEHKNFEESEKICKEFLDLEDEDPRVQELKSAVLRRMIQAIAKQGKAEQALKLADNYIKARKGDWFALELKAWVQREIGKVAEAAKTYEEVLELINNDKRLSADDKLDFSDSARYILSGVYVDLNKIDKAAEHLKSLLSRKPDDPTYNNDLGYIWADHDMNLEEAEQMIRKALEEDRKVRKKAQPDLKPEEDKDNAAYLDSLGWVLFKRKKYKEALEPLLKAVQDKSGQHIEIFDHLGDVHLALGEKDKAIAAWKKGVESASDSKREKERKAKVKEKIKTHSEPAKKE